MGRRAKDRAWKDVFVVIQKGELNMFIFGEHGGGSSGVVGGGNWLVSVFFSTCLPTQFLSRKMPWLLELSCLPIPWLMLSLVLATTDNALIVWS
jgi:hypothetical protein